MNSIKKTVDRLHSRVDALIQKVEMLDSENQQLHNRIKELEQREIGAIEVESHLSKEEIRSALDAYIEQIDMCIEEIRTNN